jgi:hypothetical protein
MLDKGTATGIGVCMGTDSLFVAVDPHCCIMACNMITALLSHSSLWSSRVVVLTDVEWS